MGQTEPTRQSDEILPPILGSSTNGSIVALPITTSVLVVDLTSWANSLALPNTTVKGAEHTNPLGQYITMIASGTVFYAFAPTAAALASLSATATSTVPQSGATAFQIPGGGTQNAGVPLPGFTPMPYRLPPGPAPASGSMGANIPQIWGGNSPSRFLGALTASGTATLFLHVSSR